MLPSDVNRADVRREDRYLWGFVFNQWPTSDGGTPNVSRVEAGTIVKTSLFFFT